MKTILGIETSCDDTSLCILRGNPDDLTQIPEVIEHLSFSQEEILKDWGGVVPEIASRNHLVKLTPLLDAIMKRAKLKIDDIDLVGVTTNPGLLGPLLTGLNMAKTLSLLYRVPIFPVNHLFAHMEAIHLTKKLEYPYLGLLVSGGHSLYLLIESPISFTILGSTIDDAAGEAFDKGGKLMGLDYPAGRIIDQHAAKGDPKKYIFPIALKSEKKPLLSFSGVKTSLRYFIEKNMNITENKSQQPFYDLCSSYQFAIVEALRLKLKLAIKMVSTEDKFSNLPIVVGGGVACNKSLRETLKKDYGDLVHFVKPSFCTDNGAMVANYTLRNYYKSIPFPECLKMDARAKYLDKKEWIAHQGRKNI